MSLFKRFDAGVEDGYWGQLMNEAIVRIKFYVLHYDNISFTVIQSFFVIRQ